MKTLEQTEISEIIRLYKDGLNYKEIGSELNRDPRTIGKIIKNSGVEQIKIKRRSKYNINEDYFKILSSESLWLIGLLAADGWINKDRYIGIAQSGDVGKDIIEEVKRVLEYDGPTYEKNTIGSKSYSINITSNEIVNDLLKFNIIPNKSLVYKLPDLSDKELINYLRGYIDGDGSVGVYDNGNGYEYLVLSFVGTKEFIEKCGKLIPVKYSGIRDLGRSENCWEVRWYGKQAIEFGNWIYYDKNLYNSKKFCIFDYYIKNNKPDYLVYEEKKEEVKKLLTDGKKVMEVSKITGIPFQTIYTWRKKF
jgi:hypothetical protein